MNQKQLEKKVRYWQKILKLDHWDITCELVDDPRDIDHRIACGWPQPDYFTSHLKFVNPKTYRKGADSYKKVAYHLVGKFDRCVIHELLHCHTTELAGKRSGGPLEERLVTYLEKAFYDLHKEIYE